MIQIRRSTFETNSSSQHSIVVSKKPFNTNEYFKSFIESLHDGELFVYHHELQYGRNPFQLLATFEEKLYYAMSVFYDRDLDIRKHIFEVCKSVAPEFTNFTFKYRNKQYVDDVDKMCDGYCDDDILRIYLNKNNITIEEFLLNPKYIVIVDGDEYCIWESIKSAFPCIQEYIETDVNWEAYDEDEI